MRKGKIKQFFRSPPWWALTLLYIVTIRLITATGAILFCGYSYTFWAKIVYALAFVSLVYSVYTLIVCIPKAKNAIVSRLSENRIAYPFITSYSVRTVVFSCLSFALDAAYVGVNGVTAIVYWSGWYAAMAAYYMALALIRLGVILSAGRTRSRYRDDARSREVFGLKVYGICGASILILEMLLSVIVSQMSVGAGYVKTGRVLAILTAFFTFYKLAFAIRNIFKAKKYRNATVQCLRNINLTDALVTLLSLQVTMMAVFGDRDFSFMNAVTGAVICAFTIGMGVVMILQAIIKLRRIKNGQAEPGV